MLESFLMLELQAPFRNSSSSTTTPDSPMAFQKGLVTQSTILVPGQVGQQAASSSDTLAPTVQDAAIEQPSAPLDKKSSNFRDFKACRKQGKPGIKQRKTECPFASVECVKCGRNYIQSDHTDTCKFRIYKSCKDCGIPDEHLATACPYVGNSAKAKRKLA